MTYFVVCTRNVQKTTQSPLLTDMLTFKRHTFESKNTYSEGESKSLSEEKTYLFPGF